MKGTSPEKTKNTGMRIGLFGGTFNPIHLGHLHAVKKIQDIFRFDKIYLIPSASPPHKELSEVVRAKNRMEMIQLALAEKSFFLKAITASNVELKRAGASYTIDTVSYFRSILPDKTRFYFILGIDAFLEIDTWKSYIQLFDLVSFIVMTRNDSVNKDVSDMEDRLKKYIKSTISDSYRFSPEDSLFFHTEKKPVFITDVEPKKISSTMIRELIRQKKSINNFLPENVKNYIRDKGLYL